MESAVWAFAQMPQYQDAEGDSLQESGVREQGTSNLTYLFCSFENAQFCRRKIRLVSERYGWWQKGDVRTSHRSVVARDWTNTALKAQLICFKGSVAFVISSVPCMWLCSHCTAQCCCYGLGKGTYTGWKKKKLCKEHSHCINTSIESSKYNLHLPSNQKHGHEGPWPVHPWCSKLVPRLVLH